MATMGFKAPEVGGPWGPLWAFVYIAIVITSTATRQDMGINRSQRNSPVMGRLSMPRISPKASGVGLLPFSTVGSTFLAGTVAHRIFL